MQNSALRSGILSALLLALVVFAMLTSTMAALATQSSDLFATWMAGEFMSLGQIGQIYPATTPPFTMTPPPAWEAYAATTAPGMRIFPYIYPPIWADLTAGLTRFMTFATFDTAVLILHQTLLLATTFLAARLIGLRGQPALILMALTYAALALTTPIGVALNENQPQILVSFLIVFAFERAASGHPRAAGLLLALAASIKGYPLLLLVVFAARKDWPAVAAFAIGGALLALTSIALAGWPLHLEYMKLLAAVSKSALVTNFSFTVDAFAAATLFFDDMVTVSQSADMTNAMTWTAIAKSPIWVATSSALQIIAVGVIATLAARRPQEPLVLPLAAALFAFLSPLSWAYTYLPAYVFLGALPLRVGAWGWAIIAVMGVMFHPGIAALTLETSWLGLSAFALAGTALSVIMIVALFWVVLRGGNRPATPPHPAPR